MRGSASAAANAAARPSNRRPIVRLSRGSAPIDELTDRLADFLPSTVGAYEDKTYSYGFYDVALTMVTRKSTLEDNGIRVPTPDKPWTKDEFDQALETLKATGSYAYPRTSRPRRPASGTRTPTRPSCRAPAET